MSEQKFSAWQVAGTLIVILTLCTFSLATGVFLGYQWGEARGLAKALADQAGHSADRHQADTLALPLPLSEPLQANEGHAYLGVKYQAITPALAEAEGLEVEAGAVVREVWPGSPAAEAGLEVGDIIQQVDGKTLNGEAALRQQLRQHQPADVVALTILRKGKTLVLKVTLGSAPVGSGQPEFNFGFQCDEGGPDPCPFQPTDPEHRDDRPSRYR